MSPQHQNKAADKIHDSQRKGLQNTGIKIRQCTVSQDTILNTLESQYENDVPLANFIQIFSLSQREHLCLVLK